MDPVADAQAVILLDTVHKYDQTHSLNADLNSQGFEQNQRGTEMNVQHFQS
jgi:hypothetical protein